MSENNQELEVKFYVWDLERLERRLQEFGAHLIQPRIQEINLRFDTPDGRLGRTGQVLRLRQDSAARLTYKGPGELREGARLRKELEFTVSDFETAKALFESLGFGVSLWYEKFRAVYELRGTLVTLDELPYGNFVEIEGADPHSIHNVADLLGLDWEKRAPESYTGLFEGLRQRRGLEFRDLTFANFEGLAVDPEELGLSPADNGEAG